MATDGSSGLLVRDQRDDAADEGIGPVPYPAPASALRIGKTLTLVKTITDEHTADFARVSLDDNPLHFDETIARQTRFRGRIAHGMHTAALFSGVLARLTPWCAYLRQEVDFTAPVRTGDHIAATGVIAEITPKDVVAVDLVARNQDGAVVARGRALVKKLKEAYEAE